MQYALVHPSVIDAYLETNVSHERVAGPSPPFPDLHISRFGVIPKSNQPGKWRLILDLSSPEGHSVNDGIPKPPFSVQYVTVDSFIEDIMDRGRGTLMAKPTLWRAPIAMWLSIPRIVLSWEWFGVANTTWTWLSHLVSVQRPTSSPLLQTMVQWMRTHNYGVDFLCHYLDDFLTLGPPASPVCYNNL